MTDTPHCWHEQRFENWHDTAKELCCNCGGERYAKIVRQREQGHGIYLGQHVEAGRYTLDEVWGIQNPAAPCADYIEPERRIVELDIKADPIPDNASVDP